MTDGYNRLFLEDVEELDKNGIPQDLQIVILKHRYIGLFDYEELVSLCLRLQVLDTTVSRAILTGIWKEKVEYELRSSSPNQLLSESIRRYRSIYTSLLLRYYEFSQDTLATIVVVYCPNGSDIGISLRDDLIQVLVFYKIIRDLALIEL